jgi:hypothetical protein
MDLVGIDAHPQPDVSPFGLESGLKPHGQQNKGIDLAGVARIDLGKYAIEHTRDAPVDCQQAGLVDGPAANAFP